MLADRDTNEWNAAQEYKEEIESKAEGWCLGVSAACPCSSEKTSCDSMLSSLLSKS